MRNLIAFFQKFKVFLVFAILEIIALSLYVNSFESPNSKVLSSINSVSGSFLKQANDITQFLNTPYTNKTLRLENTILRRKVDHLNKLLADKKLHDTIVDSTNISYLPATVIFSTYGKRNNFITIDKGRLDGVKEGMGVFTNDGIVGVVHAVSEHYSLIKSVLASKIYIDVMIEGNGAYGLLDWNGKSPLYGTMTGVANDVKLKRWANIVTRGSSGIFPRGLHVGKVADFKYQNGKPFWDIKVWYQVDYRRLTDVYVVMNNTTSEFKELKKKIKAEEPKK